MAYYDHFSPPEAGIIVRQWANDAGQEIDARKTEEGLRFYVGRVVQGGVVNSVVEFIDSSKRTIDNTMLRDAEADERYMWDDGRQ